MNSTYATKAACLVRAFARDPQVLPGYLRTLPLWGRQPLDLALPWISYPALAFLNHHVRPTHNVFEYGGGGSTLWFAQRVRAVRTVENHPEWHRRLLEKMAARKTTNVTCELHILRGEDPALFDQDPFFTRIESGTWDIVLVDCYQGYSETGYGFTRPHALERALQHVCPGGLVILDDSWMFPELLGPRPGWRITDLVGPGPCRYGVTSTALFEKLPSPV